MDLATTQHRLAVKPVETTVLKKQNITKDLLIMWLKKPADFTFKPGQYCTIGLDGIERAYSISSAPHEDSLELFVELVPPPDGMLTPHIWKLDEGDKLTIRPRAKGLFTFNPSYSNHLFVSTVTGVVPFVSILRDYLKNGRAGHRFYVLQGASYGDEFSYDKELESLTRQHPDLITFIPTVSRPTEKRNTRWTGEMGRVNTIVEKYVTKFRLQPKDSLVYACGHPGMIEDVKAHMIPKTFKVVEERFWKE